MAALPALLQLCVASGFAASGEASGTTCGVGYVLAGETSSGLSVCEDLRYNGSFAFYSDIHLSSGTAGPLLERSHLVVIFASLRFVLMC